MSPTADGLQVFDSDDEFEQIIADRFPENFNANNEANDFDPRSDNKGLEPENVVIARAFGRVYAFITLERIGRVMIYDVTDPTAVSFVDYGEWPRFHCAGLRQRGQ